MSELVRPKDIILIRHGESEANIIFGARKHGKQTEIPSEFFSRHDSEFRLSQNGRLQAKKAGTFILHNYLGAIDYPVRFMTSPYNRTMETAVEMGVSKNWEFRDEIREREWAEATYLSPEERRQKYEANENLRKMSYYYWRAPGGESVADVVSNRAKLVVDTIYRENSEEGILMVTHGEFIWAMRTLLESLHPFEFNYQDKDPSFNIPNCFILRYSRVNPYTSELSDHFDWRQGICPWDNSKSWDNSQWVNVNIRRRTVSEDQLKQWYDASQPLT